MNTKQYSGRRRGMTMIEVSLALLIMSIVIVASLEFTKTSKENLRMQKELHFASSFDKALKASAVAILDFYEPICSAIPTDATAGWGWNHASCDRVSPLPVKSTGGAGDQITYNIEGTVAATATLRTNIIEQYAPYCSVVSSVENQLKLRCSDVTNLTYDIGGGPVQSVHGTVDAAGTMTATGTLGQITAPTYTLSYFRTRVNGPITENITYTGSLLSLWQKRQNYSLEKMKQFENLMKAHQKTWITAEVENAAPTGLNSVDDEFIPWYWRAFGDLDGTVMGTAVCTVGAGVCTNYNVANMWQPGNPTSALLLRRLNQNIFNPLITGGIGERSLANAMFVDGFGNQVRIAPILSQCTGTNLSTTCTLGAPAVPADDYFTGTMRPPYSMAIFADGCNDTAVSRPMYCRNIFSF